MTECFLRSVDQLFQALPTDCPEYQLTGGRGGRGGRGCPHSIDQLTLRTESGNDIIKNLEDPDMYASVTSHRLQVVIENISKLRKLVLTLRALCAKRSFDAKLASLPSRKHLWSSIWSDDESSSSSDSDWC